MRFTKTVLSLLLAAPAVFASFDKVVRGANRQNLIQRQQRAINDELLAAATPLAEYEAKVGRKLMDRGLEGDEEGEGDDYAVDYENMYSFSGYSLKYAKCQPVQYFSEDAIAAGEHSPMVTQDIVILRLCPEASCSSSSSYGCYYNYADYAVRLEDYVAIMLKYKAQVREYTCEFCNECMDGGRRLEDGEEADNEGQQGDQQQEQQDQGQQDQQEEDNQEEDQNEDQNQQQNDENGNGADEAGDDAAAGDDQYKANACNDWDTYCSDYNSMCDEEGDDDSYIDYEKYVDYLDCAQVNYNGYAYFVRPRCDSSSGGIRMAVYYDNYCIQYAGNDVSFKELGLGFKDGMFQDFYSGECIDCSESDYLPYDSNSMLCNKVHATSARCTEALMYDLFENQDDESSECSYIESIRFGAYDEYGNFASTSGSGSSWSSEVTIGQKTGLGVSIAVCVGFIIYACYLHHSMTNLLIKSLSHRELLPPSRPGSNRSRGSSKGRRSSSKRLKQVGDEPDWDSGAHA